MRPKMTKRSEESLTITVLGGEFKYIYETSENKRSRGRQRKCV